MKKRRSISKLSMAVLDLLTRHAKPLSFKAILHSLPAEVAHKKSLSACLEQLRIEGKISRRKDQYALNPFVSKQMNKQSQNTLEGILSLHKRDNLVLIHQSLESPIRIYPENTNYALPGDRVQVEMTSRRRGGKQVGRVLKILERTGFSFLLRLHNQKLETRTNFKLPVRIEDIETLKEGQWYQATVLPRISRRAYFARITGEAGKAIDLDLQDLLSRYSIPHVFSKEVLLESHKELKDQHERVDLRELKTMTIDGADARDFDDAISIKTEGSDFRLWVHIADVSHFVREKGLIDQEALKRSTSIYFPRHVVPMLPEALSNDQCSLKPGVDRRALTCEMLFSPAGALKAAWCSPSMIQSNRRFTYDEVQSLLDGHLKDDLEDELNIAEKLHKILASRKLQEGAMDFELPEPKITMDGEYKVSGIKIEDRCTSHRLIEDFMIAANETIARFCRDSKLPALYRHHPPPTREKIENLMEILKNLGLGFTLKDHQNPKTYQQLLERVEERYKSFLQPLVLRSMQQAIYDSKNPSHFGLARETYCHFTSPIRRYPDLVVHRQLKNLFTLWNSKFPFQIYPPSAWKSKAVKIPIKKEIGEIGRINSLLERRAVQLERDYTQRKKVEYMGSKIGEEFAASVTGITAAGIYCEITTLIVEGFLPFQSLPGYWTFNERLQIAQVSGRKKDTYRLGDPIQIKVQGVDKERFEVRFTSVNT